MAKVQENRHTRSHMFEAFWHCAKQGVSLPNERTNERGKKKRKNKPRVAAAGQSDKWNIDSDDLATHKTHGSKRRRRKIKVQIEGKSKKNFPDIFLYILFQKRKREWNHISRTLRWRQQLYILKKKNKKLRVLSYPCHVVLSSEINLPSTIL